MQAEGRQIVVMSGRRSQLSDMAARLTAQDIPFAWAVGGTGEVRRPHGAVLLATYAYCAEGMDLPDLDTCLLATSQKDVEQCVGRILRRTTQEHQPRVYDVHDMNIPLLSRQFHARRRYFQRDMGATMVEETMPASPSCTA